MKKKALRLRYNNLFECQNGFIFGWQDEQDDFVFVFDVDFVFQQII